MKNTKKDKYEEMGYVTTKKKAEMLGIDPAVLRDRVEKADIQRRQ